MAEALEAWTAERSAQPAVVVSCVLCGGQEFELVCSAHDVEAQHAYLRRFHGRRLKADGKAPVSGDTIPDRVQFTQDYATAIVACRDCGVLFRNPRPPAEAVFQAYKSDHYGTEFMESALDSQRALFEEKAPVLERWLPVGRPPSIVEVGSFVGGFLAVGQERGWRMLGIDPGREVTDFCRQHGLPISRGTLQDAEIRPGSLDALAIWNTFDQLPDPRPTLEVAGTALRRGGVLAIRVPNGACFRAAMRLMDRRTPWRRWVRLMMAWNNLLTFPYLHGYSVPTLDRLTRRFGFERVAVQPDTLVRIADRHTKVWASWEERVVKVSLRLLLTLASQKSTAWAPWIDVYYRASE